MRRQRPTEPSLDAIAVSKSFIYVTSTFLNMSFTRVIFMGFVTGFASCVACVGLAAYAHRLLSIRPESVYRIAYKAVLRHPKVEQVGRAARRLVGGAVPW